MGLTEAWFVGFNWAAIWGMKICGAFTATIIIVPLACLIPALLLGGIGAIAKAAKREEAKEPPK